ncbi:hypothetical protein P3L10_020116 [Capsicum annuum]
MDIIKHLIFFTLLIFVIFPAHECGMEKWTKKVERCGVTLPPCDSTCNEECCNKKCIKAYSKQHPQGDCEPHPILGPMCYCNYDCKLN